MIKKRKIIFSADDFAKCDEMDYAILRGFETGVLTSTCIMANGANYNKAVNEILPQFKTDFSKGGLGCHLNIIEGKSLLHKNNDSLLCDKSGNYNKGYFYMFVKSFNKDFMKEVEEEFRSQIERVISDSMTHNFKTDHINSHVHVHAIPAIFDLTCRLAKEYGIDCIRTQYENFYTAQRKGFKKYLDMNPVNTILNLIKNLLLKTFTLINRKTLKKYNLNTNDRFVGLLFTGFMDEDSVYEGINAVKIENRSIEILVHPYLYKNEENAESNKRNEYLIVNNPKVKEMIERNCDSLTNFSDL